MKVQLLTDSFTDYVVDNKLPDGLTALSKAIKDIEAVIDEYNSIKGSSLTLEWIGGRLGDNNLEEYKADTFDNQTIVIGFTDLTASSNEDAPAWTPLNDGEVCTITRRHILFRKKNIWTFGPPATTNVNGKSFGGGVSFRGVLMHEMGHALGLSHSTDTYAVMVQGARPWTRGLNEEPQAELLPDDINGLLALYSSSSNRGFDVSVTNTWFLSPEERTEYNVVNNKRHDGCGKIEKGLVPLRRARDQQILNNESLEGDELKRGLIKLGQLELDIAEQENQLWECRYREESALQTEHCTISSRGDSYAAPGDGALVKCGVNSAFKSQWRPVSATVCPGEYLQVRYTLNNKSKRKVKLKQQLWLSTDDRLEVNGGDIQSVDTHDVDVDEWSSASIGRVYRVPPSTPDNAAYRVYIRAVPYSTSSGESLWSLDEDPWNNSIRVRKSIAVIPTVCPP